MVLRARRERLLVFSGSGISDPTATNSGVVQAEADRKKTDVSIRWLRLRYLKRYRVHQPIILVLLLSGRLINLDASRRRWVNARQPPIRRCSLLLLQYRD
jgi:hypothetical protein